MSAFETARDMSVGVLAYVRDYVSHIFGNVFPTATTNAAVATTVKSNVPAYETPYVWAREFLEESGFNLTERIPALFGVYKIPGVQYLDNFPARRLASTVPPELSLHWILSVLGGICEAMIEAARGLDMGDWAWVIVIGLVMAVLYHWRFYLLPMLSRAWEDLKEDVAAFVRRQFPPPPSACNELPPGTTTISSEVVDALHTSADAIQRRLSYLRMTKFNYVRSRTGIVFNLNNFSKLQKQLTKAQEALKKEKATKARVTFNFVRSRRTGVVLKPRPSEKPQKQLDKVRKALRNERASHQETRDFLEHQTNARADAEEELEELRAKMEAEEPELDENAQLETIEETGEESPAAEDRSSQLSSNEDPTEEFEAEPSLEQIYAQVERLQNQLSIEEANYRVAFKKKELFRQGGRKLKQELEDLQAEYNVLEDSRDTWKETCEALEEQADVKAVRALRDQMQSDNAHNERRIDALQTQLRFESNNREEAQSVARDLRASYRKLQEDLKEANTKYESLETAYGDLDNMHDAEERANEDKDEEITVLKAKYDLLQSELIKMDERQEERDAGRSGAREAAVVEDQGESWQIHDFSFELQRSRTTNAEEGAPLRRVQSAPLWLPLPHHGDTFDHLYDVSDYGEDDSDREDEEDEDRSPDSGDHDDDHDSQSENGDGPSEDDNGDDDHPDDGRNGGVDKVALDAGIAQEDHIADSPGRGEDRASSELTLDNGQLPANLPMPEPSSQESTFSMNGSAPNFVPSVRPRKPTRPLLPHHQAYIASQHGSTSSDSNSDSAFASAAESSLQNQYPFPAMSAPAHTPAPKAAGPGQAKNPHVQKLNQEVKRLDWRRKSGMPDRAEDEEGVAAPDNALDYINNSQPSSSSPAPERDVPQQDITAPLPLPQSRSPARESSPPATDAPSPAAQRQTHDGANAAHDGEPARRRRPSNFFPGIENLTKTHNEEVSDALADYLSQHPTKSLSDSIWAKKPDASSKATPQQASPAPAQAPSPPPQQQTPNQPGIGALPRAPPGPTPNPPAGSGVRNSIWSPRGNGRGRGGWGTRGPAGSGRGGAATSAPNPGSARGSTAAGESFRRLQESIARAAAEEEAAKERKNREG